LLNPPEFGIIDGGPPLPGANPKRELETYEPTPIDVFYPKIVELIGN